MPKARLAVVTGGSSGIGLELAKCAGRDGYDLILAADTPFVDVRPALENMGVGVESMEIDLATSNGVEQLLCRIGGRPVDVLVANAGVGHGGAFLDQKPESWRHTIDTNVTGTLLLLQPILRKMVDRDEGRVLITGSIAGYVPGAFNAVYNATKAFLDNFSAAISNELKDTPVTVTCLKPGATDTAFFARAEMLDTKVGQEEKADAADVARTGWEAMKKGERTVVHGLANKARVMASGVVSEAVTAEIHRKQAEPGSAED